MSFVLLLTASISPYPSDDTRGRINPKDRERDYFKATKYYLSKGFKVVFVDNSNTKSDMIVALGNEYGNLEYLHFETKRSYLGKSHGEVEIMQYAVENSVLLSKVDYLIKITGRYLIKNISEVLLPTNQMREELYINPTRNLRWADSRLMMMRKSYYFNYFIPTAEKFLDESKKVYMENAFIKSMFFFLLDGGELHLWPAYPAYDAYDGTFNEKVSFGFLKRMKYNLYYKFKKFAFKHRA